MDILTLANVVSAVAAVLSVGVSLLSVVVSLIAVRRAGKALTEVKHITNFGPGMVIHR
ncbi:MAG TPA: hypothetical protein VGJ48_25500 [Pyrinomonadaceae bacterium]